MKNNQRFGQSKYLLILVFVTIVSSYYFFSQAYVGKTSFNLYKHFKASNESTNKLITQQSTTIKNPSIKRELKSRRFLKIHERIVLNRIEKRVVFYRRVPEGGYGNSIYSMISAFLAAIISDSALLIDWPSIDTYIESPLDNTFANYSDGSFLDINKKSPPICTISTSTKNTWSYNKQLDFLQDLSIPDNCSRFYVSDITAYFFDLAANLRYADKLVSHGFVQKQTVEKARNGLNDSKLSQNTKLDRLFQIGFEFAGHVLNNYWLLKPRIKQKVNSFIEKKFSGDFIIGLQMRFYYLIQEDIQTFINCALDIEAEIRINIGNQKVKWYVSTDQTHQIQSFLKQYSDKIVVGEGKIGHVAYESDAYERAIVDIELLSHCNEIILTGPSTFGFIGSIKSQKMPYFVEGKRSSKECKLLEFHDPSRAVTGETFF